MAKYYFEKEYTTAYKADTNMGDKAIRKMFMNLIFVKLSQQLNDDGKEIHTLNVKDAENIFV